MIERYTCLNCGEKFQDKRKIHRKFCSRTCSNRYHLKNKEIIEKISKSKMGKTWEEIYGERRGKEMRIRLRQRMIGNKCAKGNLAGNVHLFREKNPMFGKTHDEETREKMKHTWFKKQQVPWNKGYGAYIEGEKNPNWLGGLSFEPYGEDFNEELKKEVKEKYKYKCFVCGMTEEESLRKIGRVLIIHHIDFNKKNNAMNN